MEERFATVLIDPSMLCREGLASVLAATRFRPQERLERLEQLAAIDFPPGLQIFFLVDLGPDADVAGAGVRGLKAQHPGCCLLVLTDRYDQRHMLAVLAAGANGYLMKTLSPELIVKSLDLAALGGAVFPAAAFDVAAREAVEPPSMTYLSAGVPRPLSNREVDILKRLSVGESNKVIARLFGIAEATVKVHIKAILRKIQVRNRTQAAIWALERGLSVHMSQADRP